MIRAEVVLGLPGYQITLIEEVAGMVRIRVRFVEEVSYPHCGGKTLRLNLKTAIEPPPGWRFARKRRIMSNMAKAACQQRIHPLGESEESIDAVPAKSEVDTLAGKIHVFWDPHAQVTALGPVTLFIAF